jgi:peroxiredoxin
LAVALGAASDTKAVYPKRHTFVIGKTGLLEHVLDTKDPAGQAKSLLATLASPPK